MPGCDNSRRSGLNTATTPRRICTGRSGYTYDMADDDDWVGTPPEGRYSRDRAKPEFWRNQKPLIAGGGVLLLLVVVLLVIAATQ